MSHKLIFFALPAMGMARLGGHVRAGGTQPHFSAVLNLGSGWISAPMPLFASHLFLCSEADCWPEPSRRAGGSGSRAARLSAIVSRMFRTFGLAERHPALAHAVICANAAFSVE